MMCTSRFMRVESPNVKAQRRPAFGASAYFILSDGKEASSSVNLTFNDVNDVKRTVDDASVPPLPDSQRPVLWEAPDSDERILDLVRNEFRLRFSAANWAGKIAEPEVLSQRKLTSLATSRPAEGADYCVWLPDAVGAVNSLLTDDPGERIAYSVTAHDQDRQGSTSIAFEMRTAPDVRLGGLQCIFPRASSASGIAFSRWTSAVGDYIALEIRP